MAEKPKIDRLKSVDLLMRRTALTLVRDFQDMLNDPCFCSGFQSSIQTGTVAEIRQNVPTPDLSDNILEFKAAYQLASVFKRYRFETDLYTDSELQEKAINSFLETQHRVASIDLDELPCIWQLILDRAASYVSKVLGPYDEEEHRQRCRFGKKASVGIPARAACEAARWTIPISGSSEQISWFASEMSKTGPEDDYLQAQLDSDPKGSIYQETSSLTLTLVPKTFKSLRAIMPNTTIGSYMSYGIGEMIRLRLKRKGYNIKTLQQSHRVLARQASLDGSLTTADLSSASDSISVDLVRRLFPSDWFDILSQSRIGYVELPNNQIIESKTFCTMGIGYTFPLQTLVFLSLLKAIQSTMIGRQDCRTISVYGDDMIYPSSMHEYVLNTFSSVGFVINVEKTFSTGHFRESCGGDYFHGVDVRPFQPQNGSAFVSPKTYEAILYKFANTLLARWEEYEIGKTLKFLASEITEITRKIKLVPSDFPDDSGIKCSINPLSYQFLERGACALPKHVGHGIYRFSFLRFSPKEREEKRHEPYYWLRLRALPVDYRTYYHDSTSIDCETPRQRLINDLCGCDLDTSPFVTRLVKPIQTFRSKISGCRLRRTVTCLTVSHTGHYTRQSGTSGFEDRR